MEIFITDPGSVRKVNSKPNILSGLERRPLERSYSPMDPASKIKGKGVSKKYVKA